LFSTVDGWYVAGNLFLGGLIGWLVIDPASGAMWKIDPEYVNVSLENSIALTNEGLDLVMVMRDEIPDQIFKSINPQKVN
jgi:hypothetical protein